MSPQEKWLYATIIAIGLVVILALIHELREFFRSPEDKRNL